jgi:CHAT domain-containing protein
LRNGILYKIDELYAENAWELGKVLLPTLDKEITKLIIIPDGLLNTLPFEVLLEDKIKKDEVEVVKNYPFWLKKYEISYAFSATFYLNNITKFIHRQEPSFLGYAPVFADEDRRGEISETNRGVLNAFDEYDSLQTRGILNGRYITPIPNTELEVDYLQNLFVDKGLKSKIVTHGSATESIFKAEDFSNYSIIHFATHGFVNSVEPELSGVLFMGDTTSGEDGILYSHEILALKLHADLVTLSACETGLGQVIVGEGVLGLSRAFTISGASHLIVSYWKVSDSSTSDLMKAFYSEALNNNGDYSAALQNAKLKLINSGEYAQPYYWSPFVLIKS